METPIKQPITAQDLTATAFKSVEARMKVLAKTGDVVNSSLSKIGSALTIGAIVGVGKAFLDSADNVNDMSQRLGISTEALSQYQHVAKMSGTDFEALATAIKFAERTVSEATGGSREATKALRDLGLNVRDLAAMSPESAFEAIGDAISKLPSASDRTAAAMKVFGRSGTELIPVFKDGAAGVRALREEADRLGLTLDKLSAEKAAKANDAIDRMTGAFKALGREIAIGAAPAVESFADRVTSALASGNMKQAFREAWKATADAPPEVAAEFKRIFFEAADPDVGKAAALKFWAGFLEASKQVAGKGVFGSMAAPLLPGMTEAGRAQAKEFSKAATASMLEGLKSVEAATDGLTESETRYFQALERSVQLAQTRQSETDHQAWLADQLMPTDSQAIDEATAATERHYAAVRAAADEYEQLRRETDLGWQLMARGIETVADQLSNNLAAAITGAKVKLLDLASIAESLLSMAFRYALNWGVNALLAPGASALGGPGSGVDGLPMPGLKSSAGNATSEKAVTINQNITVTGKIDPNDKLSVRRLATALYDETLKIQKHHGPMGVSA